MRALRHRTFNDPTSPLAPGLDSAPNRRNVHRRTARPAPHAARARRALPYRTSPQEPIPAP